MTKNHSVNFSLGACFPGPKLWSLRRALAKSTADSDGSILPGSEDEKAFRIDTQLSGIYPPKPRTAVCGFCLLGILDKSLQKLKFKWQLDEQLGFYRFLGWKKHLPRDPLTNMETIASITSLDAMNLKAELLS